MKTAFNSLVVTFFVLAATPAHAAPANAKQRRSKAVAGKQRRSQTAISRQRPPEFTIPKELTFLLKLEAHPKLIHKGSLWEVTYELRTDDLGSYMQWASRRSEQPGQREPGFLLRRGTFTQYDLASDAARQSVIKLPVPVRGELFRRFRQVKSTPQAVWMSLTVRINDRTSGLKIFRNNLSPFWDLRYFINATTGKVIMGVSPMDELRWSIIDPPPWVDPTKTLVTPPKQPS